MINDDAPASDCYFGLAFYLFRICIARSTAVILFAWEYYRSSYSLSNFTLLILTFEEIVAAKLDSVTGKLRI